MKLDTSSYYPKSPLDDDPLLEASSQPVADKEADSQLPEDAVQENVEPVAPVVSETHEPEQPPTEGEGVISSIAHILSLVLVPLLMPVYGTILAFGLSILSYTGFGTRFAFTAIVAGFNLLIPAVVIMILKKAGLVHDVGLNDRKERFVPYLVSILCLVGTGLFMYYKGAPMWLVMFYMGGAAAGIVEVIVNNWWKISVHAAGMAGIVALLLHLHFSNMGATATEVWLLIAIGLTGILGAARIWLGRHTLGQVLAGYVVGFCSVYFMMYIQ